MSIFQPDLIITSGIRAALLDLRKNLFLVDDMFKCTLQDELVKKAYSQEAERAKAFLKKEIHLYTEHRVPDQAKYPCIVFAIGSGQEDSKQGLSNDYASSELDANSLGGAIVNTPRVIVPSTTPLSYDPLTGQIEFQPSIDLSTLGVYEDMYIFDSVNAKHYQIRLVMDNHILFIDPIDPAQAPNLTNMAIYPTKNIVKNTHRSVKMWENHTITLLATDPTELLYLYTFMSYIMIRYNFSLFGKRGFNIASYNYGEVYRASNGGEGDPNNLYGRLMNIRGFVIHSAIETTALPLAGLDIGVDVCATETPMAIREQVDNQGWGICDCPDDDTSDT